MSDTQTLQLILPERSWPSFEAACLRLSPEGLLHEDRDTFGGAALAAGSCRVTLYLSAEAMAQAIAELEDVANQAGVPVEYACETLPDRDWNAAWKAHYRPLRIGRRLRIEPLWLRQPAEPDVLPVVIDPGQAFGTGTHETTQLAAVELERVLDAAAAAGEMPADLLDVGTGSAILAIAAVRLGVPTAVGTDFDPVAVENAHENLAHNQLTDRIELHLSDDPEDLAPRRFPIVVANIISGILMRLRDSLIARTAPGGLLLLSGVLVEERDAFMAQFATPELTLLGHRDQGDWTVIRYRKAP